MAYKSVIMGFYMALYRATAELRNLQDIMDMLSFIPPNSIGCRYKSRRSEYQEG